MRRACFAAVFAVAGFLLANPPRLEAQNQVAIDGDDIGGVVTGPHGPEAGVWVIAETRDLPTHYAKMVVTDDQGRYVVPDLPKAKYQVWVRGYGLIDSPKTDAAPGQQLNLTAVPALNDAAAAQYYPAIYWFTMLKIPDKDQFGGKSDIPAAITQTDWLTTMKNQSCVGCHQLGQLATRTIPAALGEFKSGEEAWIRRVQSGQASPLMANPLAGKLGGAPFKYFGDWTDGIARGDLPFAKPPRPQGIERNIVVTTWEWGNEKQYLHDLISSDKRDPTVNSYGALYGSPEYATDHLPVLDPKTAKVSYVTPPVGADVPEALGPGHSAIEAILTRRRSRSTPASGSWRCSIQRRRSSRSSTPVSTPIICSSVSTTTTHCGRAAAVQSQAGSTLPFSTRPVTRKRPKAGRRSCSTLTATASSTITLSPDNPRTRTKTCGLADRGLTR